MGRCNKCGKKVSKSSRVCKSKNKNKSKENNANNAQIINVDVVPENDQLLSPVNGNAQENNANSGQIDTRQSQIGNGAFAPFQQALPQSAAASPLGGLTAEEVKNLLKGATDYAAEATGQNGYANSGCRECEDKHKQKSSKKSKKVNKNKQKQYAKNNKVNVNLAVILTRSSQTPTLTSAQSADNYNEQAPVTMPVELNEDFGLDQEAADE